MVFNLNAYKTLEEVVNSTPDDGVIEKRMEIDNFIEIEDFDKKFDDFHSSILDPIVMKINEILEPTDTMLVVFPNLNQKHNEDIVSKNVLAIYLTSKKIPKPPTVCLMIDGNPYDQTVRIVRNDSTDEGKTYKLNEILDKKDNEGTFQDIIIDFTKKMLITV